MDPQTALISVFNYTDFRRFLFDAFHERKRRDKKFNYRYIAAHSGFKSPGFFTQVLTGQSNLGERTRKGLANTFGLDREETGFFELMVAYNQAVTHAGKKNLFERMLKFRKGSAQIIDPNQYRYYDKWYYSALRALLSFHPFNGDCAALGKQLVPRITGSEVRKALVLLENLGLISKEEGGRYRVTQQLVTTGDTRDSIVINNFIVSTFDIARDALYHFEKSVRSFSALTLSLSSRGYESVKGKLDQTRREIMEIAAADRGVESVYQMNFQLFPLSENKHEENSL